MEALTVHLQQCGVACLPVTSLTEVLRLRLSLTNVVQDDAIAPGLGVLQLEDMHDAVMANNQVPFVVPAREARTLRVEALRAQGG